MHWDLPYPYWVKWQKLSRREGEYKELHNYKIVGAATVYDRRYMGFLPSNYILRIQSGGHTGDPAIRLRLQEPTTDISHRWLWRDLWLWRGRLWRQVDGNYEQLPRHLAVELTMLESLLLLGHIIANIAVCCLW